MKFYRVSLTPPDDCSYCGYRGVNLPEGCVCTCCGFYKPAASTPEAAGRGDDCYFMVRASEVQEESERVPVWRLAREIHDLMCSCRDPERCRTEGVTDMILEAIYTLLAKDKWSVDFEDGWIRVERVVAPPSAKQAAVPETKD